MRKLLTLLLVLMMTAGVALAADPANPADPEMVAQLLPGYTLVRGIDDGDELRLLMRNAENELVFVGGVAKDGSWRFTESTPLPEGTILGYENFTHSLAIPSERYDTYDAVSLRPYADGTWGVSLVMPADFGGMFFMGKHFVFDDTHEIDGHFGDHPWADITTIDWASLPDSYAEAVARVDSSAWAVVNNPNPEDRLHLRGHAPNPEAVSYGKYYNRTPVKIREYGEDWCAVTVCGQDGYMMTKYLAFGEDMAAVEYAGPGLSFKENLAEHRLYLQPRADSAYIECDDHDFHILGVAGDFYHVWFPDTEEYYYIRMDDLWPGNG